MMYMSFVFYIKAQFVPEVAFLYPAGMPAREGGKGRGGEGRKAEPGVELRGDTGVFAVLKTALSTEAPGHRSLPGGRG